MLKATLSGPSVPVQTTPGRIDSIDVLRALTMVLMIFVNDLGSLRNIPEWLDHVKAETDGIGLADTIFPAFLFIMGMSLPYAIANRRKKGDSDWKLILHIFWRTLALVIMGVFLVNGENINHRATGIGHYAWNSISCLSFILIWKVWPSAGNKKVRVALKSLGILTLCILAFIYRGSEGGPLFRFNQQWWGILGLLGWAYLAAALITVFSKGKFIWLLAGYVLFCSLSILYFEDYVGHKGSMFWLVPNAIIGGTIAGFTMGGVLVASIFEQFRRKQKNLAMTFLFLGFAAVLVGLSYITHLFYPVSKLDASPPWLFLCSALTLLAFTGLYWLIDMYGKAALFRFIRPAGTDTLLCYLIPYFLVSLMYWSGLKIPVLLLTGSLGLIKSFLFALLCVWITGRLNKAGVRLKI